MTAPVRVTSRATGRHATSEDPVRATGPSSDRAHLARALAVAERARGTSSPNPHVGCVLVRDGVVVAEAATSAVGGPHAEATALATAGDDASGATAYVTLEPCGHHGRTAPCATALSRAGVVRVVYGLDDPHVAAAGGAQRLREDGVEVVGGLLAEWVGAQLEGFVSTVTRGRPHVTLKLAHTVDGRLGLGEQAGGRAGTGRTTGQAGATGWVTGAAARTAVHRWRAAVDAVLVGSGTVLADDPRLDVRHVPHRGRQPRAVVLDTRLRTPPDAKIARDGTIVLTGPEADPDARARLAAGGVAVETVPLGPDGHLDPHAALERLVVLGVTSVLAEPGRTVATGLVAAGLVDRLVAHVAVETGPAPLVLPVPDPPGGVWRIERLGGAGVDVVLHLVPGRPGDGGPPSTSRRQEI